MRWAVRRAGVGDGGGGHPGRAEQVDLDRLGQRGIEGDGGGGVDDHVGRGQRGPPGVVEPEAVLAHVAGHGLDPAGHLIGEGVAQLVAQPVEAVVLDDLASHPRGGVGPASRPDQHRDVRLGQAAHDPLDQGGAQEAGGAGDEEALAGGGPGRWPSGNVYHLVGRALSTMW